MSQTSITLGFTTVLNHLYSPTVTPSSLIERLLITTSAKKEKNFKVKFEILTAYFKGIRFGNGDPLIELFREDF